MDWLESAQKVLTIILACVGSLGGIFVGLKTICKPFSDWIDKRFNKKNKQTEDTKKIIESHTEQTKSIMEAQSDMLSKQAEQTQFIMREIKSMRTDMQALRKETVNGLKELQDKTDINLEANKCMISANITRAYNFHKDKEFIDEAEKDSIMDQYFIYHNKMGHNGKIEYRYNSLMEKEVC